MADQRFGHGSPVAAETSQGRGFLGLEGIIRKKVDLLNVRQVSTVFQKEVIMADRRIYTGNEYAADEFEMLTLSFYQKLNQERAEILAEFTRTGKAYNV